MASMDLSSSSIRDGSRIKKADLMGKEIIKAGERGVDQEGYMGALRGRQVMERRQT